MVSKTKKNDPDEDEHMVCRATKTNNETDGVPAPLSGKNTGVPKVAGHFEDAGEHHTSENHKVYMRIVYGRPFMNIFGRRGGVYLPMSSDRLTAYNGETLSHDVN